MPFDPRGFPFDRRPERPNPHGVRWTPRAERMFLALVGVMLILMMIVPISADTIVDTVRYIASLFR